MSSPKLTFGRFRSTTLWRRRNRVFRSTLAFLLLSVLIPPSILSQSIPYLSGRVNDYAGMLSSQTRLELERALKTHEDSSSNQVVILTIPTLDGANLEEYSLKVMGTWKLGQKGKDNGVLILVARDDHKVRIEVGYGLESTLTDAACSRIIRHEIVPRFKNGDYDGGILSGVRAILKTIEGSYTASDGTSSGPGSLDFWPLIFGIIIFIIVVGVHSTVALFNKGFTSWFHAAFLVPFWLIFPYLMIGGIAGVIPVVLYVLTFIGMKLWFSTSPAGAAFLERWERRRQHAHFFSPSVWGSSGGGSSSAGGGFSGGGGRSGGGGSSGSW